MQINIVNRGEDKFSQQRGHKKKVNGGACRQMQSKGRQNNMVSTSRVNKGADKSSKKYSKV